MYLLRYLQLFPRLELFARQINSQNTFYSLCDASVINEHLLYFAETSVHL